MTFENGIFNLTNWTGNVIMPTLSGLFFAIALIRAAGPGQHQKWMWAGFLSLMVSGILRGFPQRYREAVVRAAVPAA
jgi:hypothetical protein